MAASKDYCRTAEEACLVWGILLTWPVYAMGGLYVLGSVIGWLVLAILLLRIYVQGIESNFAVPKLVSLWCVAMVLMLIALVVAHYQWHLGLAQTIKSTIGWAKGWALLAVFFVLGAIVKPKPELISRACCLVSAQALIFAVISIASYFIGAPESLFISPFKVVGGPGPEYFEVRLFGINPETSLPRWFFFAPWAPAAGLIACLLTPICFMERSTTLRILGLLGCLTMCVMSQSRAGLAILLIVIPSIYALRCVSLSPVILSLSILIPAILLFGTPVIESVLESYQSVKDARPESSQVRSSLANIALQRWQNEAPIWGHGIVERGPMAVKFMPIGTHHSWYGLLYVKGGVGALALLVPLIVTTVVFLRHSFSSQLHQSALVIVVVLFCYSFFENLEILVYLYWPAVLWLGIASSQRPLAK